MEERCDLNIGFWMIWGFYVKYFLLLLGNGTPWVAWMVGVLLFIGSDYLWMPMLAIVFWGVVLWGVVVAGMSIKNQHTYWPLNRVIIPPVWSKKKAEWYAAAPDRQAAQETAQRERDNQRAAARMAESARVAAFKAIDTRMGVCPKCGCLNISSKRKNDWYELSGWQIVGVRHQNPGSEYTARHCNHCHTEWPT